MGVPDNVFFEKEMVIDTGLLDSLSAAAKTSPRKRMNYDLRTSPSDNSQRMLNALEPGTEVPVHRHRNTTETFVILRGRAIQYFYDEDGNVTEEVRVDANGPCRMISVEAGRWHRISSLESGTVIFECKDGAFEPRLPEDEMNNNQLLTI